MTTSCSDANAFAQISKILVVLEEMGKDAALVCFRSN